AARGLLAVAWVVVRARGAVRLVVVLAARGGVARILGAGISVVAVDGVADAGTAVAALVERALIGVLALGVHGARVSAGGDQKNEGEDERGPQELFHVVSPADSPNGAVSHNILRIDIPAPS